MAICWLSHNGVALSRNGYGIGYDGIDPYNPLNLPPFTLRASFESGYTPTSGDSRVLVDATTNTWDITRQSTDWSRFIGLDDSFKITAVLGANTSGVANMSRMFYNCYMYLTSVPLFDTRNVTDMSEMFRGTHLTTVPLYDTSHVEYMESMFYEQQYITAAPAFDMSSCKSCSHMFFGATSLVSVPAYQFRPRTSCISMFAGCTSLTSVDTGTVLPTGCTNMFKGCTSLGVIPAFADVSQVKEADSMFMSCNATSGSYEMYQRLSSKAITVTRHNFTFNGNYDNAQIPSDWGGLA